MKEAPQTELELEVVDLGDAKEVTLGILVPNMHEESVDILGRFPT